MNGWTYPLRLLISPSRLSPAPSLRRRRRLDPWRWRWSWSTLTTKSKTPSGRTPPAPTWRSADWASTTATLSPPASTPPPPMSATAREDTRGTARCTATRRRSHEPATPTHPFFLSLLQSNNYSLPRRCYNECRVGQCSGSPRFECVCSLGWTSDPATLVLSGVECDVDCGCNFHSTCITAPGICDECQGVRLHTILVHVGVS